MSRRRAERQSRTLPTVVLVTHIEPPVHGQAVMAAALVEQSAGWTDARLEVINSAYVEEREALRAFSFRKLGLMLRYLWSAIRTVRTEDAELVVVTPAFYSGPFLKDAFMICALKAFTRARLIAWVNMDPARLELSAKSRWYRWLARYALSRVDWWVGSAPTLLAQWPSFIPDGRRFAVTYGIHGVPVGIRSGHRDTAPLRVCFISSLDAAKGWTDLVEAAEGICASHPDVEFHFYGDVGIGWTRENIVERFRASQFPERIVWHDVVRGEEKWSCLSSSDLFCLPSHTEQLPLVVLEAMASGLPVVATRVGAMEEAVVEGEGGWLVAPGRPSELAQALSDALGDRARLRRFGEYNAARQRAEFSIERFGVEWERLLRRLAMSG